MQPGQCCGVAHSAVNGDDCAVLLLLFVPGDAVLRTGKEVWERTLTARSNPTTILKVRKSALDTYGKDKKAMETHQAMRCFR